MRTIKRDIVGAFIFSKDGKVLLGKTGVYEGLWVVPGGGIDEGETKAQALAREVLEETGIDISGAKITPFDDVMTGQSEKNLRDINERVLVKMRFYDSKVYINQDSDKIAIKAEDDLQDLHWFSKEELQKLQLSPPTAERLQKLGYLKK